MSQMELDSCDMSDFGSIPRHSKRNGTQTYIITNNKYRGIPNFSNVILVGTATPVDCQADQ